MTEESIIKEQIAELDREIEELKKRLQSVDNATVYGRTTVKEFNSDLGIYLPVETMGRVPMPDEEKKALSEQIELEIRNLEDRKKELQDKLFLIEWKKPENVAAREAEEEAKKKEEDEQALINSRRAHDQKFQDEDLSLSKLRDYLEIAGMYDLSEDLFDLRFAFRKRNDDYIIEEADLRSKERAFTLKRQTTKDEYKQIKKTVIRLSKKATYMAKKYKELYRLYIKAYAIVDDIERKGISKKPASIRRELLIEYFNQPTSPHFKGESLGYQLLEFYRNFNSKYNEDVRNHKI